MFGGLMGMFDANDPFFAGGSFDDIGSIHRRQMQQMTTMLQDPFGMMMRNPHQVQQPRIAIADHAAADAGHRGQERSRDLQRRAERNQGRDVAMMGMFNHGDMFGGMMLPGMHSMMGGMMGGMHNLHPQMMQASNNSDGHMYSQSSFMSYSSNGNGAPKVYQATSSTTQAPGGVQETRKTVRDSESGVQKMAVGHHIGDRGHVISRSHNVRTDERDESQDYFNIDEEEAGQFNDEWRQKTSNFSRRSRPALSNGEGRSRYDQRKYTPSPMEGARPTRSPYHAENGISVEGRAAKPKKKVHINN